METGLITPNNKFIAVPYYEIGKLAENICEDYIKESEANRLRFQIFSQYYSFFKPHLDFLLFELGYKMVNPLLHKNSIWYVCNDTLILKKDDKIRHYSSVSDTALGLAYINPENVKSCMMDNIGRVYNVNKKNGLYHETVCDLVINQYLIYDKELFEEYRKYNGNGIGDITAFAKNMLGFSHIGMFPDNSGAVVFCSEFHNSYKDKVFKRIKELNPKFDILPYSVHTKESLKVANRCIERVDEMNEDRRLRL